MIDLNIVKTWAKNPFGYSIAPAKLSWIKEGSLILAGEDSILDDAWSTSVGNRCRIGHRCHIDRDVILEDKSDIQNGVIIGEGTRIGSGTEIGADSQIGQNSSVGRDCILERACSLPPGTFIGMRATLGERARDPIDLGFVDGYRKCIAQVDGIAYIGAGCRWFTLDMAIKHWSNKPDRIQTLALMMAAKEIARIKGWKAEV